MDARQTRAGQVDRPRTGGNRGRLDEGIGLTLTFLRQKREETRRLTRIAPVDLGMPALSPRAPAKEPPVGPDGAGG